MENTKGGGGEKMPESGTLDKILNRIDQLDDKFSAKFEKIDERFDKVDEKFNKVDDRFNKVDEKFDEIDERFNKVDEKFEEIDERFNKVDERFDKMDDRLDMIYDQTVRLTLGQTALKTDIDEIKTVYNYLNNEVARNSKDIYVIKNKKN